MYGPCTTSAGSARTMRDELDRLFGNVFSASQWPGWAASGSAYPAVNVWETEDSLTIEAETPGLRDEDVDISVVGNQLTIKGRRPEADRPGAAMHRRERPRGEFSRSLRLPFDVDAAQTQAVLRDGVLTVRLPKAAAARPRKVQVTSVA